MITEITIDTGRVTDVSLQITQIEWGGNHDLIKKREQTARLDSLAVGEAKRVCRVDTVDRCRLGGYLSVVNRTVVVAGGH